MEETNKSKFNPMFIVVGVAVLVLIGGFILISSNKSSDKPAGNTQETQTPVMQKDISNFKTINIEAGSFYYNPKEIRVKKGETITIVLKAIDMMHDFNIDEFNVRSSRIKAGDIATIQFTADKIGEFEYYCSVGQHRQNGQVGKLIVEE